MLWKANQRVLLIPRSAHLITTHERTPPLCDQTITQNIVSSCKGLSHANVVKVVPAIVLQVTAI